MGKFEEILLLSLRRLRRQLDSEMQSRHSHSLLQHADIGVAVGNSSDSVKQAADLIVADCNAFGICELVEILDHGNPHLNKKDKGYV